MKKNGFTLVELLGIVAIISLIAIISVPTLIQSLKRNETRAYQDFLKSIELAAEHYVSKYSDNLNLDNPGNSTIIKIGDLVNEGLISSTTLNPLTEEEIDLNGNITVFVLMDYTKTYIVFSE